MFLSILFSFHAFALHIVLQCGSCPSSTKSNELPSFLLPIGFMLTGNSHNGLDYIYMTYNAYYMIKSDT